MLETNSSGTVSAVNVHAPDGLVARKEGSTWKYYQFDQQGNVVTRTNSSGSVQAGACYDAYGLNFTAPSGGDCFRYNARWGYTYDSNTGLTLCQHRFYDAQQGRWLNRDPIGYSGGVNLYGYCESGPVHNQDLFGLITIAIGPSFDATFGVAGTHDSVAIIIDPIDGDVGLRFKGGSGPAAGLGAGGSMEFEYDGGRDGIKSGPVQGVSVYADFPWGGTSIEPGENGEGGLKGVAGRITIPPLEITEGAGAGVDYYYSYTVTYKQLRAIDAKMTRPLGEAIYKIYGIEPPGAPFH